MSGQPLAILFFSLLASAVLVASGFLDRRYSLLSPFWAMLFPVFVGTSLKSLVYYTGIGTAPVLEAFGACNESMLLVVSMMITVFFLITAIVYFAVPSRQVPRPRSYLDFSSSANGQIIAIVTALILMISAVSLMMLLRESGASIDSISSLSKKRRIVSESGSVGAGLHYKALYQFAEVNAIVLFAFWLRTARARQSWLLWISILASVLFVLAGALLLSERTPVALLAIPMVGFLLFERAISFKQFVALSVAALLFANFIVLVRSTRDDSATLTSVATRFFGLSAKLVEAENGTDVTKITRIVDHYSQNGNFLYGDSFRLAATALVPRRLWPDKPIDLNLDYVVTKDVYGLEPEVESGVKPPSLVGECYMNGAWPAVVFGAILYGLCLRFLMVTFFPREGVSVYGLAVFLILVPLVTYLVNMTYSTPVIVRIVLRIPAAMALVFVYNLIGFPRVLSSSGEFET